MSKEIIIPTLRTFPGSEMFSFEPIDLKGLTHEIVDSIQEIAARYNISQSKVKTQLHRTRNKLQLFLESEGIYV